MHPPTSMNVALLKAALQYPHTGRTSCIGRADLADVLPLGIAVPSHGSNFMHRTVLNMLYRHELELQYPHTGRTSCIRRVGPVRFGRRRIAVPSHGSNFMHPSALTEWSKAPFVLQYPHTGRTSCIHLSTARMTKHDKTLQYPHTGRTSCIVEDYPQDGCSGGIAVPSHGSNFMHLTFFARLPLEQRIAVPSHGSNFMHLPSLPVRRCIDSLLQYPHTGRTSCIRQPATVGLSDGAIAVPSHGSNFMHLVVHDAQFQHADLLQYPHTGRTSCIPATCRRRNGLLANCSTLTRVELHASRPWGRAA